MKQKLLGNLKKGLLFILSAPAGTGKTTLVQKLLQEFPEQIVQSISSTTRGARPLEITGKDYFFLTKETFQEEIEKEGFLEWVELYNDYYGTSKRFVQENLEKGKHVFLVIDTQGAEKLKGVLEAIFIFLEPPSLEILRERLTKRQTETTEQIERRLHWAEEEMKKKKMYDYTIINDDIEIAYQVLRSIVIASERKI